MLCSRNSYAGLGLHGARRRSKPPWPRGWCCRSEPSVVGLFRESLPDPFGKRRGSVDAGGTSLHHFALEIDKNDYENELQRLQGLGAEITTFEHRWCHWRSIYVKDPEGNVVELVCFDESIR